jgi:hypothetical protein
MLSKSMLDLCIIVSGVYAGEFGDTPYIVPTNNPMDKT